MHKMEIQMNLFLCYLLFSSGEYLFYALSREVNSWGERIREELTQKKIALVQKVIRRHFPQAVYGTCSSCCKRFRNRSRMHPIFSSYFWVLQFMVLRAEKREEFSGFVSFPALLSWKLTFIHDFKSLAWLHVPFFFFLLLILRYKWLS